MSDEKRLYTNRSAKSVALLHKSLRGVSEVVIYGGIARGCNSEYIQLLLVVNEEELFQDFVEHLKEHRKMYQGEMSESMCKRAVAEMLWNGEWPSRQAYEACVDAVEDVDITVVPYNWHDRLDEIDKNFNMLGLSRMYAYPVA